MLGIGMVYAFKPPGCPATEQVIGDVFESLRGRCEIFYRRRELICHAGLEEVDRRVGDVLPEVPPRSYQVKHHLQFVFTGMAGHLLGDYVVGFVIYNMPPTVGILVK